MSNTNKFKILRAITPAKFFFILTTTIFIVASCNKPTDIGLATQPQNDLLNVGIDSTLLITKTIREDTLRTDQPGFNAIGLIGKYMDPIFGEATSSMYSQLRLTAIAPTFDSVPVCDSIVLSLVYTGASYPKLVKNKQKISVYQLAEDIKIETPYFSHSKPTFQTKDLANNYTFTPKPTDSIKVQGVKVAPQLRVPLDKAFGQDILNNEKTGKLATNAAFQTYLKGLYITTENTTGLINVEGNILTFTMAQSNIIIYYHGFKNDSLKYNINLGEVVRFAHFTHAYTATASADINTQLNTTAQTQNNNTYIQSMAGVKTRITMPNIMDFTKHSVLGINRAELVIKVVKESLKDSLAVPPTLILYGITDDGKSYIIPDAFESSIYFGGMYNSKQYEYRFNVARYVQQVLIGSRKNNGFYLVSSNAIINANRVMIGGGGAVANPYQMKLYITYTK